MREQKSALDRLGNFSDAVIAVIITLMALEIKTPEVATMDSLFSLWPTVLSYAMSYLLIAIIWINHHHLMGFVTKLNSKLVWINFLHLFAISFVPFSTAWIARTKMAPLSVAVYASVFVITNIAYIAFQEVVFEQADEIQLCQKARTMARRRSAVTLFIFSAAALCSYLNPKVSFALVFGAIALYMRPEAPGSAMD